MKLLLGQRHNVRLSRDTLGQVLGIDAISGAQSGSNFKFSTIEINGKYSGGASHLGSLLCGAVRLIHGIGTLFTHLNGSQANSTKTEHRN
jgi:hypothetical protein